MDTQTQTAEAQSGTTIFGIKPGTPAHQLSCDQLKLLMDEIVRWCGTRDDLSADKIVKLEPLEYEWGERKNIPNYRHIKNR